MARDQLKGRVKELLAERLGPEPGGFAENSPGGRALIMLHELQRLEACEQCRDDHGAKIAEIKLKALVRAEDYRKGGKTAGAYEERNRWIVAEFEKRRLASPSLSARAHMTNIGKSKQLKEMNGASSLSYKAIYDIIHKPKKLSGQSD